MSFKMLDAITAIGASNAIKVAKGITNWTIDTSYKSLAATKISAATIIFQGSSTGDDAITGVITNPTLTIGSTAERVANILFYYRINNVNYVKTAVAAGSVFTSAHVIGDGASALWGAINVYINAAGTIVTKVPLTPQIYASAALAHAAADAIPLTSELCYLGRILIQSDATTWTANTDDMTNGSDLTTATFLPETSSFIDLTTVAFSAADIVAKKSTFHVSGKHMRYVRIFLSALTGTGEITCRLTPVDIGGSL